VVKLLEVASGNELATLEGPDPPFIAWMSFSPDGSRLAAERLRHHKGSTGRDRSAQIGLYIKLSKSQLDLGH
jgi:hypothetical protein